jgi:Undecaprenyl-phosphate glucose phosphotransferase
LLKQRHQLFVFLLCIADGAVVTLACYLAWAARRVWVDARVGKMWPDDWQTYLRQPLVIIVLPAVLLSLWSFRLYQPRRDRSILSEQAQILKASLISVVAVVALLWSTGAQVVQREIPIEHTAVVSQIADSLRVQRVQSGVLAIILPVLLGIQRASFRIGLRYIRRHGKNLRHVLIIGHGRLGQIACRTLDRNSWTGLHPAGFLSHHDEAAALTVLGRPVFGGLSELENALEETRPDAVYLAIPTQRAAVIPGLLKRLEKFALDVRIIPDVHPRYLPQSMTVSELDGMPILSVRECPLYGLGGMNKRLLDILVSLGALVLFSPLMALVAALVRSSGPGPVIFKQRRVSLGGEVFNIYKFRTMGHAEDENSMASEGEPRWTERDDPRITPIGRWLRRTSLDELPQLLNVLKGEMSLVGPRPERPELIERFREDWRGYMLRQHVKAGMTGWAQVNGLRGDTSLRKRLQHDLFYVRHWSIGFDLKILWLTAFRGFVHPNAH